MAVNGESHFLNLTLLNKDKSEPLIIVAATTMNGVFRKALGNPALPPGKLSGTKILPGKSFIICTTGVNHSSSDQDVPNHVFPGSAGTNGTVFISTESGDEILIIKWDDPINSVTLPNTSGMLMGMLGGPGPTFSFQTFDKGWAVECESWPNVLSGGPLGNAELKLCRVA